MQMRKQLNVTAAAIAIVALLAACGGAQPAPTVTSEPRLTASPAPTVTPEPTVTLAPTPEPNAEQPVLGTSELPDDLTGQLDAFLVSQVHTEGGLPEGAAPGLVLLVDTPDGRYLKAAGASSIEDGTPMTTDDRLQIGSNTKSMVVVVLLQLQEEGVLSLDDMLGDWLPDLAAQIPNGDEITLRQLANHTAGIWDYGDPIIGEAANDPDKLEQGFTPEELVQYAIDNGTPDFKPDGGWKYSNTGYILLGMIVEKAAGQTLSVLLQERIFDPLGLVSAALIEGVPQEGEITTDGYWWKEDGTRLNTTNWNVSQGWAAGGVAMTAEDLAAYGTALAAGELFDTPVPLASMLTFDERALTAAGGSYGLGLIDFGDGYMGHEGQTAGFQSLWFADRESDIIVVGLTNSASYQAFRILNVKNILSGDGLRPFNAMTLLPVAEAYAGLVSVKWQWTGIHQDGTSEVLEQGPTLSLSSDDSVLFVSAECGVAAGTFTSNAQLQITFDLDASSLTCTGEERPVKLVDDLSAENTWRFENGDLVITLAESGDELRFSEVQGE